jgi:WD40 repeat protein
VCLLFAVGACTSRGSTPPEIVEDHPAEASSTAIQELTVTAGRTWGSGRALRAERATNGALVVVTTTGAYVVPTAESPPEILDQFDPPSAVGPIAVSADSTRLAVITVSPAALHLYDLNSRVPLAVHSLPADTIVRSLTFETATPRLTLDTSVGPLVVEDESSAPRSPVEGTITGAVAFLPDGALVAPATGTADLVISHQGAIERVALPLTPGTTVLDARSSPDGSVIGVSVGTGENLFERQDQIVLFDAATFQQLSSIDVGRLLEPPQWNMSNSAVAVTEGEVMMRWAFDGQPAGAQTATDSPIVDLRPIANELVSIHADGTVARWSSDSTPPSVIREGGISIESLQMSSDGATATSVDRFGSIATWNVPDGSQITSEDRFATGEATDVAISIDGVRIGIASTSGRVTVLDQDLAPAWSFDVSESPEVVGDVTFDPSNGSVVTGLAERLSDTRFDDTVTVWDPNRQAARFSVGGESEAVLGCSVFYSRVRFNHEGTQMAVTSHDFSVLVIDTGSGVVLHELAGTTTIQDLAFTPDDDLLIATYEDGTVTVWQTTDYTSVASYRAIQGGYLAIAVLPDSATMAAADITGSISLIDLMTGAAVQPFAGTAFRTSTLAVSPDGALLAAPMADSSIGIWSVATGGLLTAVTGHAARVTGLEFAPQGGWLASSSMDGTVRTWTIERVG